MKHHEEWGLLMATSGDYNLAIDTSGPIENDSVDAWGRAVGGHAQLDLANLALPGPDATLDPPGYVEGNTAINRKVNQINSLERGHLIGKQFGGQNTFTNLTPLWRAANNPAMSMIENRIAAALQPCVHLKLDVTTEYGIKTPPGPLPQSWQDYLGEFKG